MIESFFSTLTHELLDHERHVSPDGAQCSIAEWIDYFYNTKRRHTFLGNMSPIKYELACQMRKRRTSSTCPLKSGKPTQRHQM